MKLTKAEKVLKKITTTAGDYLYAKKQRWDENQSLWR